MNEQGNSEGLLSGYRVLDLADEKGLLCGKVLGDFGADVIKIERPGGDPARNIGPFHKGVLHPERSLFWLFTNTSKRGITLNIETADGREIFKQLVKTADFVVESFEPGYMDSLGLGYPALEKIKPDIIMTSITPFGQSGPYAHLKATDIVGAGLSGMMRIYGEPDRSPLRHSQPQFFFLGSIHGALGSVVAHCHRQLTGEGQYVDVSCQQAATMALMMAAEYWDIVRAEYVRAGPYIFSGRPTPPGPINIRYIFPCKDGHVMAYFRGGAQLGMVLSAKAIVAMANREGMLLNLKDYDWAHLDVSKVSQGELGQMEAMATDFFLTKTKAELFDEAVKESMLICPATTVKDILESPQLNVRDFWVEVEHPELGDTITYPGAPVKPSETPWRMQRRAPLIGEHNEEIYQGELGLPKERLSMLRARGAI